MTELGKRLVQEQGQGQGLEQELEQEQQAVEEEEEEEGIDGSVDMDPMAAKVERQLDIEEENTLVLVRKASSAGRRMVVALHKEES